MTTDMPDGDLGDEDDEQFQLSPEQAERLRRQLQDFYKQLLPTVQIPVISPKVFQPLIDAQKAIQKQIPSITPITSALLELNKPLQSQIGELSARLTQGAFFGVFDRVAEVARQIADQQTKWLENLRPALAGLKDHFYPPNLRNIEGLRFEDVESVVMLDGIALYEVPRAEIAEKLLAADGSNARREILGRRWKAIADDCRDVLGSCQSAEIIRLAAFVDDALDALEAGHTTAAQSLATNVLDTILRNHLATLKPKITPSKSITSPDAYGDLGVKQYIALAPIWQAYQLYQRHPVPRTFSRHATAHAVCTVQYSRRNAIQALMLVCGLLRYFDHVLTGRL